MCRAANLFVFPFIRRWLFCRDYIPCLSGLFTLQFLKTPPSKCARDILFLTVLKYGLNCQMVKQIYSTCCMECCACFSLTRRYYPANPFVYIISVLIFCQHVWACLKKRVVFLRRCKQNFPDYMFLIWLTVSVSWKYCYRFFVVAKNAGDEKKLSNKIGS